MRRALVRLAATLPTATALVPREYFYHVDAKGQLFTEDCKHRNFVTALKDKAFLNFFYRQLQPNTTHRRPLYPFVSPCGKEFNFVKVDDSIAAAVFSQLDRGEKAAWDLKIGGSDLREPFDPNALAIDEHSGRFYQRIAHHRHLRGHYGLLHALLAESLSPHISWTDEGYSLLWDGTRYPIMQLVKTED